MAQLKFFVIAFTVIVLCACEGKHPAQPGNEVGNGGNGLVCRDAVGNITSVRLLDFYEAKVLRDTHYDFGVAENASVKEKLKGVFSRLEKLDAGRAEKYRQRADVFLDNTQFGGKVPLPRLNDYGYVPTPTNCKVEQLCIQKSPRKKGEKLYTVDLDLWDRLDADNRAGLILHEIIYEDAIAQGHTDSVRTRYLTALITSRSFEALSPAGYTDTLRRLSLGQGNSEFFPLWVADPHFQACANQPFRVDLRNYSVLRKSDDKFLGMDLPGWMSLRDGFLEGQPKNEHFGKFRFRLKTAGQFRDFSGIEADVTVADCEMPDPIKRPLRFQARANANFDADLNLIEALEGMKFRAVDGPRWLSVGEDGKIGGVPKAAEIRENVFTLQAKNDTKTIDFKVFINVTADALWNQDPIYLGHQHVGFPFEFDLRNFINDPGTKIVSFSHAGLPPWISLSSNGILKGLPSEKNAEENFSLVFIATTPTTTISVTAFAKVSPVARNIRIDLAPAYVGKNYVCDITPYIRDIVGESFAYTMRERPPFLNLSRPIAMEGVPTHSAVGSYKFFILIDSNIPRKAIVFTFLLRVLEN